MKLLTSIDVRFVDAVAAFRIWAAEHPQDTSYWECAYEDCGWSIICTTFENLLQSSAPEAWDQHTIQQALYMLARDHVVGTLKHDLTNYPRHLFMLAKLGLHSAEPDARWQLAAALGNVEMDEQEVVPVLEAYAADQNEYVRRIALLALDQRRSSAPHI